MRTFVILGAVVLAALGPVRAADTVAAVQKTLQADYDARDKAVARHDLDGTLANYAPDFVGVSRTGKTHGLKEERADYAGTFALPGQSTTTQSTLQKVAFGKAGAEADVTLRRHAVLTLTDSRTRSTRTVLLNGVYQDVWARRSGGWRLIREQEVSVTATLNGKPL